MSRIASFWNRSPLLTTLWRNVISLSEISAVNFIVGWKLFACSRNKSIYCFAMSHRDVPSSMKRFHNVAFIQLWLSIFVSMFALKMLSKAIYQVPIRARFNVPVICRKRHRNHIGRLTNDQRSNLTTNNKQCARATSHKNPLVIRKLMRYDLEIKVLKDATPKL